MNSINPLHQNCCFWEEREKSFLLNPTKIEYELDENSFFYLCSGRDIAKCPWSVIIEMHGGNIEYLWTSLSQGTIFVLYSRAFAPVTLRVSEIPCRLGMWMRNEVENYDVI